MQLYLRTFYNILRQQKKIDCTLEHQKRFNEIKTLLTEPFKNNSRLKLTILRYVQCFLTLNVPAFLKSHQGTKKLNLISANSKLFTRAEFRPPRVLTHPTVQTSNRIQTSNSLIYRSYIYNFFTLTKHFYIPKQRDIVWTAGKILLYQIHLVETHRLIYLLEKQL